MYYRFAAILAFLGAVAVAWLGAELGLAYLELTALSQATVRVIILLGASALLYLLGLLNLAIALSRAYRIDGFSRRLTVLIVAPLLLVGYLVLFGSVTYRHELYWFFFGALILLYFGYALLLAHVGRSLARLGQPSAGPVRRYGRFLAVAGLVYAAHAILGAVGSAAPEYDFLARLAFGSMLLGGFFMMLAELALCITLWRAPSASR